MKSKGVIVVILVVVFLIATGGSFWLGTYYEAQSRIRRMRQFGGMVSGQFQQRFGSQPGSPGMRPQGLGLVTGKVDKIDADTITITTRFGSEKITLTPETSITKATKGDIADIKKGSQIMVRGEGSFGDKIEAESIHILSP